MFIRRKEIALLLISLFLVITNLFAENYYFKRYDKGNGLSQQTVFCAVQDNRGFLWFGTKVGVNRFDGVKFKTYVSDPEQSNSLPNNTVLALAEAPDGFLWLGTSSGLCVYNPEEDTFAPFNDSELKIEGSIDNLTFDKQGNLWVINSKGIYCLNSKNGNHHFFPSTDFFIPTGITITQSGSVWILGLDGNIYLFNPQRMDFVSYPILTKEEKAQHILLYRILECSNGDLMVTTDRIGARLFSPNNGEVKVLFKNDARNNPIYIHTAIQRNKDEFWFGTESGIHIYQLNIGFTDHLQKSYNDTYSLSDNAVHMLLKDREDGIWVGTFFGGVNYLSSNSSLFDKYLPKDEEGNIKANVIREIHPDSEGNLWVGTEDGGLCFFDTKRKVFRALSNLRWEGRLISKNIQCLLVDKDVIWLGTFDSGIYLFDLKSRQIINHFSSENNASGLLVNGIVCFKKTSFDEILVGTMGGLYRYAKSQNRFEIVPELDWGLIHSIYEDLEHTLWVVTMGRGLFTFKYKGGDEKMTAKTMPFISNYITTIFEDSKKRIWVGTEGNGIFLYNKAKNTFSQTLSKLDYSGQIIYQIIEDATGMLWITTSNGLLRYNPEQKELNRFTTLNGLPIDQFNYNSGYQDKIGNIYFGSLKGMIAFSPENFVRSSEPLKVFFTGFQLFNKEIETYQANSPLKRSIIFTDKIMLHYDQSTFSIDFAIPTYSISQNMWYRYKLEGLDREWTVSQGPKKLYYTKLPPGKYVLHVQASKESGTWVGEVSSLVIIVKPPFWSMPLAYCLYVLIVLTVFSLFFIRYRKKTKEKECRQIETLQNEKYKEILQAKISFFTNITHEIRTPLTLIMGSLNRITRSGKKELAENENIVVMNKNTQRLLDLVNQLLDFRKIESSTFLMSFVKLDLKQLLAETYSRFTPIAQTRCINFNLTMPDGECKIIADKEALIKILSNMLNNAIKFCDHVVDVALVNIKKEDTPFARIRVNNDGEKIPKDVASDIFKPFFQYFGENAKISVKGSGLGLPLAKSLAEMHNGTFYLDDSITEMNSFVLDLPLGQLDIAETEHSPFYKESNSMEERKEYMHKSIYNILIVDDEIELRQFVCEELAPQYNILVAENGKQALEILENHVVSLIISDLMMPVMDGIELCKSVKTNIKYCHIPIVVLTAKVSLQAHIDVLESKADAYIEKPFSTEHLLAQVSNLLANRELIRSTFIRSPHAHLISVASNNIDEKFMGKMNDYVMNNLASSCLSVESLAEYMNMSVSTLYRKVKAITSLAPNDFIRLCRLKKAAEMLTKGNLRINEVAESLGFSTTSYFTSCFMKQFGITPSEFVKLNKKGYSQREINSSDN
ncbi:two-component regulator propeller domain-containing protein [uncultured Bacteroides sp.]|uniref:hybrid sensor histidine kinase/response regulator transcription factor n=1 Tax=uncultured Bacteroides sp. TaxID=162156 RepID=UPI00280B049A|nr:two-component regulator propeller domain-containing protein [uncultured Bacteroides sp.]